MKSLPFAVLRDYNSWERVPRDPVSIGTAIITGLGGSAAFAATSVGFGLTVAGVVGFLATTAITSVLSMALAPEMPDASASMRGILLNNPDPSAPEEYIYGQIRTGGVKTYQSTTGTNNKYLHMILTVAAHEVEEIGEIYINDEIVTLDGDGFVTSSPWNSKIRIKKVLGDQTSAQPDLLAETDVGEEFVGFEKAYMYVRMDYDQNVFANGIPLITAVVKGKKVYDPRSDTTAWSANAALCIRDWLLAEYGIKANSNAIDETYFAAAANVCDEAVALAEGGTQPRYEINGLLRDSATKGSNLKNMVAACGGSLFFGQGKFKLVAGAYSAPIKSLTIGDLRGPIRVQTRRARRDNFNIVRGQFLNKDQRWTTTDFPEVYSEVFVAEDNGYENPLDIDFPFTTDSAAAQRLAKLVLFRAREQITVELEASLDAFDLDVGDIITLTIDKYGWSSKEFEVNSWELLLGSQSSPDMKVALGLTEISSEAFSWDAEEQQIIQNNSSLLKYYDVPTLGVGVTDELAVYFEKLSNKVTVTTTAGRAAEVDYVQLEYKLSSAVEWSEVGNVKLGKFVISDLEDGEYDFRARAVNAFGYKGPYTTKTGHVVDGLSQPPQDVTGFTAEVNGDTINLSWEAVGDLDLSYYSIRHAQETSGATWSGSISYVQKVARPSTEVSVPANPGTYLIKAVDKTGTQSINATTVVVTAEEIQQRATVVTQTEHTAFLGVRSSVVVDAGELRLGEVTLWDDLSGNVDDLVGEFDSLGISYTVTDGEYYFSDIIERASAEQGFVSVQIKTRRFDTTSGLWDDLLGSFDAHSGLLDDLTGNADFDDTNVTAYISTTEDDPAGSPTWTEYRKIRAANVYCRAMRFKIQLHSDAAGISPAISELSATASYA